MDIHQLSYFVNVVKYGSVSKAALELYVSQPTISVALKRLENELGFPLFTRNKNKLILTPAGKTYYEGIIPALNTLINAQKEASEIYKKLKATLKLAVPHPFGGESSDLTLELSKLDYDFRFFSSLNYKSQSLVSMLMDNSIDLCIHSPGIYGEHLITEELSRKPLYVFVSKNHRLAGKSSVSIKELSNEVLSARPKGMGNRELIEDCCHQAGFVPQIEYENTVASEGISAAATGLCIAIGVKKKTSSLIDSGEVIQIPLEEDYCYTKLAMTWKQGREQDSDFNKVLDIIRLRTSKKM